VLVARTDRVQRGMTVPGTAPQTRMAEISRP
jgi:hypothetical protein